MLIRETFSHFIHLELLINSLNKIQLDKRIIAIKTGLKISVKEMIIKERFFFSNDFLKI